MADGFAMAVEQGEVVPDPCGDRMALAEGATMLVECLEVDPLRLRGLDPDVVEERREPVGAANRERMIRPQFSAGEFDSLADMPLALLDPALAREHPAVDVQRAGEIRGIEAGQAAR